ncbi:hypothetical protein [Paraburkholderia sp. SIMBA_030]|uniref:hypothetical protein n=1 Tax=Paraburkholderia sp. SIMBA_030 TaxID=3085773 RepID=UPI00397D6217
MNEARHDAKLAMKAPGGTPATATTACHERRDDERPTSGETLLAGRLISINTVLFASNSTTSGMGWIHRTKRIRSNSHNKKAGDNRPLATMVLNVTQ